MSTPNICLNAIYAATQVSLNGSVAGTDSVAISCARNETTSFQVVVTARHDKLVGVDAILSPLGSRSGDTLPPECVEMFCAVFVPVRQSDPVAPLPPGMWSDVLVPRLDPWTGEPVQGVQWGEAGFTGERFRGQFEIWPNQHQPVWGDIHIAKDTPAGEYTATLTVTADNAETQHMPVTLEVWDFTLPDGPTLENHFGGFSHAAPYYGLDTDSEEFERLEDIFVEMLVAHQINPHLPRRLHPAIGDDGRALFDNKLDGRITAYVNRHHMTNIQVPNAPFADVMGANRSKGTAYYRSWCDYLERKDWLDRSYLYMYDEPQRVDQYDAVREIGAFVGKAEPRLRRLVVEQTYTQNPAWGVLDDATDIWCPLLGYIHEPSIKRVQAAGDDVWTYTALAQPTPDYYPDYETAKDDLPPFWQIDWPRLGYRIAPWICRRYGATGLLYWATCYWGNPPRNPWDNPTMGDHWNGEGILFYPGKEAGIDGLVASVRLKNVRDGLQDYEYFVLLESLGGEDVVERIVREAVPTWGSWEQNPGRLLDLRSTLAEVILRCL